MPFSTIPGYTPTTSASSTTLADIYDPTIFDQAVDEKAIELNRFLQSGIMQTDARIDAMASGPGSVGDLPFYHSLAVSEPNYSNDDPAAKSTPKKITGAKQTYMSAHMNISFSTMDLARELASKDPLGSIIEGIGGWWATNTERRVISSAYGLMADNIANNSGDMVHDISVADAATATAANLISAEAIITAGATMGDHAPELKAIAMHSVVYNALQIQQLIQFIPNARGEVDIPTYQGKLVIVDDSIKPTPTTNGFKYTTILFGAGSFAYGRGTPEVPSELYRAPDSGNGGGQSILYSRSTEIIHPYGFAFKDAAIAGITATLAELEAATSWSRVFQFRKNVPIAFLVTNG